MNDSRLGYLEASVEQQNANFDRLYQQTVRIDQEMQSLGLRLDTKIDDGLAQAGSEDRQPRPQVRSEVR